MLLFVYFLVMVLIAVGAFGWMVWFSGTRRWHDNQDKFDWAYVDLEDDFGAWVIVAVLGAIFWPLAIPFALVGGVVFGLIVLVVKALEQFKGVKDDV